MPTLRKSTSKVKVPSALFNKLDELVSDTNGGKEDSATGRMVAAYLAGKLTSEHVPALVVEAKHCLEILDGNDDTEDYPNLVAEQRQLRTWIKKHA